MEANSKQRKNAGIIIIGSEILSGKVADQNSPFLAKKLTSLGVQVDWIITVPDDVNIIAKTIRTHFESVDWVFTSGGIGPTHDDVTTESIAKAFDVPLIAHPVLVEAIQRFYGDRCNPSHLSMAQVPEGTQIISSPNRDHPVIQFRNIFVFPGVPKFLKDKFLAVQDKFKGQANFCKKIELEVEEGEISEKMYATLKQFPGVSIGSYPEYCKASVKVDIYLEHEDKHYLEKAYQYLITELNDFL